MMDWPTAAVFITCVIGISAPITAAYLSRYSKAPEDLLKAISSVHTDDDVCERLAVVEVEIKTLTRNVEEIKTDVKSVLRRRD